jgi:hypothetical protein
MKTEHRMSDLELSQATFVKDGILELVQTLGQSGCPLNTAAIGAVNALAMIFAMLSPNDRARGLKYVRDVFPKDVKARVAITSKPPAGSG